LGYNQKRIKIILVQTLSFLAPSGQSEKFSKRLGNTIELDEALNYLDLNQLKFFLLEKEFNQPLTINSKLLKEKQEKTRLYYFQYAYVRCHQLFQKAREKKIEKISSDINLLKNKKEKKILNLLVRFPFVLEKIIEENKPHYLIYYLDELAHAWQIYYQNSVILEPKNSELTSQKLLLVKNVQIILKLGFDLIGIEALTKM
jgi:arginyl-tRNA synthetase